MTLCNEFSITTEESMLENSEVLEHQIRERAFELWQEAGCPEGRADEFWHLAREQVTQAQTDIVEDAGGHYPPTGDTQNFA
jgi:hypothetical protein